MEKERRTKYIKWFLLSLVGIILISGIVVYTYIKSQLDEDVISTGIYINEIEVSGLTKEAALKKIDAFVQKLSENELTIYYKDQMDTINFDKLGLTSDGKIMVNKAYQYAKEGNIFSRYKRTKQLKKEPLHLALSIQYDENKLDDFLEDIKNHFSMDSKNAIIQRINNRFEIEKEIVGYQFDLEATKKLVVEQLQQISSNVKIEAMVQKEEPQYTEAYYAVIKDTLGHYYTNFNPASVMRTENLRVGAKKINGTILHPNEIFSTHDQLAPVDEDHGYRPAPIIIQGRIEDGIGGGICQVATTLYNAVILSELEVIERSNHSMVVPYVAKGRDAALAGDILDLKFKNNTGYPIYLESYIENNHLVMTIYGADHREANRRIEFQPVVIEKITPPPAKIIYDETLAKGKKEVVQREVSGYKVKLYKYVYVGETLQKKELLNYSHYRPAPAIIKLGIKEKEISRSEGNMNNANNEQNELVEHTSSKVEAFNPDATIEQQIGDGSKETEDLTIN